MSEYKYWMNVVNKPSIAKLISPQQAKVLQMQAEHPEAFDTGAGTYEQMRANYREERKMWNCGGPEMVETKDIPVPFGAHQVPTRLLRPVDAKGLPILFFIHGGGMVVGDNDTHNMAQRKLAAFSGCAVIGIEYTLSPEAKYPQPHQECVAAVRYFVEHASEYGLDGSRIGFAGDSGGANLSMGSILCLRDEGFDMSTVKAAVLFYGGYGLKMSISSRLYGGVEDGLTEPDFEYYQQMYLGDLDPRDCPYYNIYVNDLSKGVPPSFIAAAELDPLADDSRLLYQVLTNHGVPCEYREYQGALHAFVHYSKVMDDAEDAIRRGAHFFARQCGMPG